MAGASRSPRCARRDDLPRAARDYLRFLEQGSGVPLYLVSVGARRDETIVISNPFAP